MKGVVPNGVLKRKNNSRSWQYGYNHKYDIVVISKDGTVGDIYNISGLKVALPKPPKVYLQRNTNKEQQYWERKDEPKAMSRISTIFQWNEMPSGFKNEWINYIEEEFDRREQGFWFANNGNSEAYIH